MKKPSKSAARSRPKVDPRREEVRRQRAQLRAALNGERDLQRLSRDLVRAAVRTKDVLRRFTFDVAYAMGFALVEQHEYDALRAHARELEELNRKLVAEVEGSSRGQNESLRRNVPQGETVGV